MHPGTTFPLPDEVSVLGDLETVHRDRADGLVRVRDALTTTSPGVGC